MAFNKAVGGLPMYYTVEFKKEKKETTLLPTPVHDAGNAQLCSQMLLIVDKIGVKGICTVGIALCQERMQSVFEAVIGEEFHGQEQGVGSGLLGVV